MLNSFQSGSNLFVTVMEDDGGGGNQPQYGNISYSGVSFPIVNFFATDDDLLGSYSFAQNLPLPIQIDLGTFSFQLDDIK